MIRLLSVCMLLIPVSLCAQEPGTAGTDHFERRIRPLLVQHCVACHGPQKQESGLRLDSRESAFAKLEFGTAVVPGDLRASRLGQVIDYHADDVRMPPKGKLPDRDIELLKAWIASGAAWPKSTAAVLRDPEAWKKHWAFQPIVRSEPPRLSDDLWSRTDIDRFVLAKLRAASLEPQPEAGARVLARRVFFDLIGLPPTVEDVQALQSRGYEQVVDELLASPHFGERWGRHWMDVSRYADTTGYLFTQERKLGDAWKYRDWLINALNNDMPIDEFLVHQIAVDRILPADAGDKLAATGFLTLGRRFLSNKHDIIDDRIDVLTRGMMGFTVTCARCHDHKYDPIPSADYYALYGVFASTREPDRKKSTVRLVDLPQPFRPYVFKRGQPHNRGKTIERRFLSALAPDSKPFTSGSGRLELARAIVDKANPLTARVFVNRVWGHLLGQHLVATPSDFGLRSRPPTHPQLLDHLAASFMDSGWSLRKLLREILLSSVYRQASNGSIAEVDPENYLLARMNRRRLSFEAHRDSYLAVSGQLDRSLGGKSVEITRPPYSKRRTVYAHIDRQNLPGVFRAFDLASPDTHAPMRHQTTVPQQGLFQLNSPFVLEQACAFAERTASIREPSKRVAQMFRQAFARDPDAGELAGSLAFVTAGHKESKPIPSASGWHYGYGQYDRRQDEVTAFTRYPGFVKSAWRGGPQLPDPRIGWSLLHDKGGHPGEPGFAAIRRWIAPADGHMSVRGTLTHPAKSGDGVVGRIVSDRSGQAGQWVVAHGKARTSVQRIDVRAGDAVDFVCECGASTSHDAFAWSVILRFESVGGRTMKFDSVGDFSGTPTEPMDVWARFAHVLMLSNEFAFVD